MLSYDDALIRESRAFLDALAEGSATGFDDQYLFLGEGRVAGPRQIEYRIHRLD